MIFDVLGRFDASGGSRKKYLGAWPLIIWEATTAKQNLLQNQLIQPVAELLCPKIWGAWARLGGAVPPGPNVEPPLFDAFLVQI